MGLFKKDKKSEQKGVAPQLPELPKLPELTETEEKGLYSQSVNQPPSQSVNQPPSQSVNQLPQFPNNSFGEKFSQNTIKEAVAGEKEGEGGFDANDFAEQMQMMQKPQKSQFSQEISFEPKEPEIKNKRMEPVFIRLDKFEDSMNLFKKAKKQLSEIETMLNNIRKLKNEEEKELELWEKEMQSVKAQIEKVDNDIFSKVE